MSENKGYQSLMTIGGTYVSFLSHSIKETREVLPDDGIRGIRGRQFERLAMGNRLVRGSIEFQPTPAEVALILPLVTGTSGVVLGDAINDVTIVIDDFNTATNTFLGRINKLTFHGRPGQKLNLSADFIGYSRTPTSAGTLSGTPDLTVRPYVCMDATGITIGGVSYSFDEYEFSIDNVISPTFMGTSYIATDLEPTDRIVLLHIRTKATSTENTLLTTGMTGPVIASPLTASIAFTNGAKSMTFAFADIAWMSPESIVNPGKTTKLRLPLSYQCFRAASTAEVVTTLV